MTPRTILVLWLALLAAEQAWLALLAILNLRHVRRHATEIPPAFAAAVDPGTRARSAAYTIERGRFGLLAALVSAGLVAAAVPAGFLGLIDDACARLPLGPYLRGAAFVLAVSICSWLANLPFSLYATFSIEARYGFNRTTPKIFAAGHPEEPRRIPARRGPGPARTVLVHGPHRHAVVGVGVPRPHGLRAGGEPPLPARDRTPVQPVHPAARGAACATGSSSWPGGSPSGRGASS